MDIPVKELSNGFALPVYGLGTWLMGGNTERDTANDARDIAGIQAAIKHGVTHIDTAEKYAAGGAEELIGEAIKGFDRSKLILATKVRSEKQSYDGILQACEESLRRLKTDYIDLYLLHSYPAPGLPIADTMRAMDRLVEQGIVKNIGVCNLTINRFNEAQKHTANKLVCNQLEYSVRLREAQRRGIIRYCQENDVLVTAWGPLLVGLIENSGVLLEIAARYGKTPRQVALNWLIRQPNVVTIPKTSNIEHLEENLGALGWDMSDEDADRLDREFPDQFSASRRVPLDYEADIEP